MKRKWHFLVENDWEIHKWWIAVDLLSFNFSKGFISITVFGFTFIMER